MAQNITWLGASYSDVPAVELPKTGGGTASFTDVTDTTAAAPDVSSGKYFYTSSGVRTLGTGTGTGMSDDVKQALLDCFQHVAWVDDQGLTYYDALYSALHDGLASISAVYTQTGTVYTTDSLDFLRSDLVVTATYGDETTRAVTAYTLNGTLTEGTSVITANYQNLTDTFEVNVSYRTYVWDGQEDGNNPQKWIDKNAVIGVTDPKDYTLVNGYNIKGYTEVYGAYPTEGTNRATSRTQVITGDFDGKTLGFSTYTLTSGAEINYGIWYGYINASTNAFNGSQYISSNAEYVFGRWLSSNVVLPSDSSKAGKRVLMIAFKITNATRNFTVAELEEILTLITIS